MPFKQTEILLADALAELRASESSLARTFEKLRTAPCDELKLAFGRGLLDLENQTLVVEELLTAMNGRSAPAAA